MDFRVFGTDETARTDIGLLNPPITCRRHAPATERGARLAEQSTGAADLNRRLDGRSDERSRWCDDDGRRLARNRDERDRHERRAPRHGAYQTASPESRSRDPEKATHQSYRRSQPVMTAVERGGLSCCAEVPIAGWVPEGGAWPDACDVDVVPTVT